MWRRRSGATDGRQTRGPGGEGVDGRRPITPGPIRRVAHPAETGRTATSGLGHDDQAVGIWPGERPQQDAVDDAEQRRRGADADRQQRDGQDGVARVAPQETEGIAQIVRRAGEPPTRLHRRRRHRRRPRRPAQPARVLSPALEQLLDAALGSLRRAAVDPQGGVERGGMLRELLDDVVIGRRRVRKGGTNAARPVRLHQACLMRATRSSATTNVSQMLR
jgi:hypothetical protein